PDFLFPTIAAYRDKNFSSERLTMLAVKYSCKERWRQILAEAQRIEIKYFLTLEPGISPAQTDEMKAHKVQLVVPESIQSTYTADQRGSLMTFAQFIAH